MQWHQKSTMFAQQGETGDNEGDIKYENYKPQRNIDHITWNDCVEKGHYAEKIIALHRKTQIGWKSINKNKARKIWEHAPW